MNNRRVELGNLFRNEIGIPNIYFQPPSNLKIQYPALIYSRASIEHQNADNIKYKRYTRYSFVIVDKNPDSEYVQRASLLPYCRHERFYIKDNMNYDAFSIYY